MPDWKAVTGHKDIIRYMKQTVQEGNPSHAYLFSGSRGVGKSLTAGIFAQALQCTASEGECPCGRCHSCIQAEGGNHPDIVRVTHEKPNLISVDEIREQVVEDMAIKPYSGRFKIYLIDEAEKMNPQAQNALLKTLEEPPAYGVIILISAASEVLLQTIRSRCVSLNFRNLNNTQIEHYLLEQLHEDAAQAELLAAFAQGSLGQAVRLARSEEFAELFAEAVSLARELPGLGRAEELARVKQIAEHKERIGEYLEILEVWYRDVLLCKTEGEKAPLVLKQEQEAIAEQAKQYSYQQIAAVLEELAQAKDRLRANVSTDLVLDLMMLTVKEKR